MQYEGREPHAPGWELYDLEKDFREVRNVYDDPAYKDVVRDLKAQLADLRKRVGDTDEKYPAIREIVEEFWDWDDAARAKAVAISHEYAKRCRAREKK